MSQIEFVQKNIVKKEETMNPYATKSKDAIRFYEEDFSSDIRPSFYHDIDRIIHALSYTRYSDKTQVFSFLNNDHISKRMIHVQLVSKIARTIARALELNEDLSEAIALGHDIGHTPIGHTGEAILNEITMQELGEYFSHNVQSVRTYMELEKKGKGVNLTIQVLDGILCHNGEMVSEIYEPVSKTKDAFFKEYQACYTDLETARKVRPMTLEGCIVRISDLIGYLGRDIEDAIAIGILNRSDLDPSITKVLGDNNRDIVNTIIMDIIENSFGKPYIKMSHDVFVAIKKLKKFNYEHIYRKANTKDQIDILRIQFWHLYRIYLEDIKTHNLKSEIYTSFLDGMTEDYIENTKDERKVIDFLAGMTDEYFISCYQKYTHEF